MTESNGRPLYFWNAIDAEGKLLDIFVQAKRDQRSALKLMRKLLKKHDVTPQVWVADKLPSYGFAPIVGLTMIRAVSPSRKKRPTISPVSGRYCPS